MFILGIDPGKINVGIVLCKTDTSINKQLYILSAERIKYQNDNKFIQSLINYFYLHKVDTNDLVVIIERQGHGGSISSNMRFVQGYLTALGAKTFMKMPITYRLSIPNYKDRKDYSLRLCMDRLNDKEIINSKVLLEALSDDNRKHDISDGFNLAYNYYIENYK